MEIPPVFEAPKINPRNIAEAKKAEVVKIVGYSDDDFKWFGQSVPEYAVAICPRCELRSNITLNSLFEMGLKRKCEDCKTALTIFFIEKWERYFTYSLWEHELFTDQYKTAYTLLENGSRRIYPVNSEDIHGALITQLKNVNQAKAASAYMDGLARRCGVTHNLENRMALHEGRVYIDMCSPEWGAVCVDKEGWRVDTTPPILFRRSAHQKQLTILSGEKNDFDEYVSLMNFATEEDKILYMGYAASLVFPDFNHPLLVPIGPQGSAKTTMSIMTRMIFDPSSMETMNMPEDADEVALMMFNHYNPLFDNCGYLSQEISDVLCRASDGAGFSKRKLFTDGGEVIFTFKRPIILNGISSPAQSQDLIERSIILELERIYEYNRKEKRLIDVKRDELLPKVRGYLLSIASRAMKNGPDVFTKLPRMADFGRWADACTREMGYPSGRFLEIYMAAQEESAREAVVSDPVANALIKYLEENNETFDGPIGELCSHIEQHAGSDVRSPLWPKSHKRMSEAITGRLKPGLLLLGFKVIKCKGTGGIRKMIITKNGKDSGSGGLFM